MRRPYCPTSCARTSAPPHRSSVYRRCRTRLMSSGSGQAGTKYQRSYYLTTPIFYPNAAPHIGHLSTLVVGDVFARFQRLLNPSQPVHFLAGTDEHGLKIQKAAAAAGEDENAFVARLSKRFRKLADEAQISYTKFMRTTQHEHVKTVQDVWRKLCAQGLIYKGEYSGWYSITDECFYTDSQITPLSTPEASKSNGKTYAVATETGSPVEWTREENYMLRLSHFRSALLAHYDPNGHILNGSTSNTGGPAIIPSQYLKTIVADIAIPNSTSLADLSVSRPRARLSWGIPVPGDEEHTIYVWFDALLVYLSGTGYPWNSENYGSSTVHRERPNFLAGEAGWPPDLQIIGKDILRFHALYLPAVLSALSMPLPKQILTHAHWTVEGKKMSKSLGNVVDPFEAMNVHGVDIVRYYLCRIGGRWREDVDWSQDQLNKYSKELQSFLGNHFLRIASPRILAQISSMPTLSLSDILSTLPSSAKPAILELTEAQRTLGERVKTRLLAHELSEALDHVIAHLRLASRTLNTLEPWSANTAPEVTYACYLTGLETLRVAGICLQPFVPGTARKLLDALGVAEGARTWDAVSERVGELKGVIKGIKLF